MTEPRRKRFQIHLSTAIVMMFVAGGLIWANVTTRHVWSWGSIHVGDETIDGNFEEGEYLRGKKGDYWEGINGYAYGWPFHAVFVDKYERRLANGETQPPDLRALVNGGPGPSVAQLAAGFLKYETMWMILDGMGDCVLLFAVWLLFEWLIRRRAAQKGS